MIKKNLIIAAMISLLVSAGPLFAADEQSFSISHGLLSEKVSPLITDKELMMGISSNSLTRDKYGAAGISLSSLGDESYINLPPVIDETVKIGQAFAANLLFHELGHKAMADYADAKDTRINFFTSRDGQFFLGQSTFTNISDESRLSFSLAGEIAADLTFEQALESFRTKPTLFNTSLLLFSGTDFLRYCIYAFYMTDGHPHHDPVAISNETGLSKEAILSVALAKTIINAFRVYSGEDYVVPYFSADRRSASLNFIMEF